MGSSLSICRTSLNRSTQPRKILAPDWDSGWLMERCRSTAVGCGWPAAQARAIVAPFLPSSCPSRQAWPTRKPRSRPRSWPRPSIGRVTTLPHVLQSNDLCTHVASSSPTYNQASYAGEFAGKRVAWRYIGSDHFRGSVRTGAGIWQLPERVHLPDAARALGRAARLCMSRMWESDSFLRQCSGLELAISSWTLPELFRKNHSKIRHRRTPDRRSFSALLLAFRIDDCNAEMCCLWISAPRLNFYRCRDASSAG